MRVRIYLFICVFILFQNEMERSCLEILHGLLIKSYV